MWLLSVELIQRFREVGEQIHTTNPLVIAKFYAFRNGRERYATEYYYDADVFYGYILMDGVGKWMYFRNPQYEGFGEFQIQRDLEFTEVFFDNISLSALE